MSAPLADDYPTLLTAWDTTQGDFLALARELTDDEWATPTALAGWTTGDVVAHISWIEMVLLGEVDPPHDVDWTAFPHITTDFGRLTEVPVDLRRSWSREQILTELADALARRRTALFEGDQDADREVAGLRGPTTQGKLLRTRIFDTWVHEQDIRQAIGRPGHLDAPGAQATAAQLIPALPMVWVKRAEAGPGEALALDVTAPGVVFSVSAVVAEDGRGSVVPGLVAPATVTLSMPWSTYLDLAAGRRPVADVRDSIEIQGDVARADVVLAAFAVTP